MAGNDHASNKDRCRSGKHEWIPENIYTSPSGIRCCIPCRTANKQARRGQTPVPKAQRNKNGERVLTAQEIERLRGQIGCMVCHQIPQPVQVTRMRNKVPTIVTEAWIKHLDGCSVARNREGVERPKAEPRKTWDRKCVVCDTPLPPPPPKPDGSRGGASRRKLCSAECRQVREIEYQRNRRAAYRAMKDGKW